MTESLSEAIASGALPNLDTVLWVSDAGSESTSMRVIDVAPAGGIRVRVLPERGLDLGQAWFSGTPLAWVSSVGEQPPLESPLGMDWGEAFGGGLLTTCGLRNVGLPSEGHGLHGTFSHLCAEDVTIVRSTDGQGSITVSGRIADDAEEPHLTVDRTITTLAGQGHIEVRDITTNRGTTAAEAPLLYHCNFGWPMWSGLATLMMDTTDTVERDPGSAPALDRWSVPPPIRKTPEWVLEHRVRSEAGWAQAHISSPARSVAVTISWEADQLPIVNQWLDANPGMGVLGIEPANCTTRGLAYERSQGTVPTIEPGQQRSTALIVEASPL
ncbi:MAG: DUF4432 family protein [Acidimicrobiia bacterium]